MSIKTAKCERTGHQILLSDGFLVANAASGEASFIGLDAEERSYDYHVAISALIKSPEALDVPSRVIIFLFAVGHCSEPETFCVV